MLKNCRKFFIKDLPIGTPFQTNLRPENKKVLVKCNKRVEYFDGTMTVSFECKKIVDHKGEKMKKPKWGYVFTSNYVVWAEEGVV